MSSEIDYVNVEEARRSRQFPVKDGVWMGCGRVVVWSVAMENIGEDEGGGTIADNNGVDGGRNWLASHITQGAFTSQSSPAAGQMPE